jgi:hypothetical protein
MKEKGEKQSSKNKLDEGKQRNQKAKEDKKTANRTNKQTNKTLHISRQREVYFFC